MVGLTMRRRLFKQRRFRLLTVLLVIVSLFLGVAIVPFEKQVGNITTYFDGIWWAISTITTVGYGDKVPVTDSGKVLGIILQILGAMLFGSIVAIISTYVSRSQDEFYWNRLFGRLDRIEAELDELQKRTAYMVKTDEVPPPDTLPPKTEPS